MTPINSWVSPSTAGFHHSSNSSDRHPALWITIAVLERGPFGDVADPNGAAGVDLLASVLAFAWPSETELDLLLKTHVFAPRMKMSLEKPWWAMGGIPELQRHKGKEDVEPFLRMEDDFARKWPQHGLDGCREEHSYHGNKLESKSANSCNMF